MIKLGDFREVLKDERADIIVTSPPYNIGSESVAKTGKRSKAKGTYDPKSYRGIREYSDSMPVDEYILHQAEFLTWCGEHLNRNGSLFYNHKPHRKDGSMIHPYEWIRQCENLVLTDEVVWERGSTHNNGIHLFRPTTERIYVFRKKGDRLKRHNREQMQFTGDVWKIPRAKNNGHNAPFPESLVENCIQTYAFPGCRVMDPYSGSGTTAVVASRLGYDFIGAEKLEGYWMRSQERLNVLG